MVTDATAIDYDNDEFVQPVHMGVPCDLGRSWEFPVVGSSNFGNGNFDPKWYDVIIGTYGAGRLHYR